MIEELRSVFGDSVSSVALKRYNADYYERAVNGELQRGDGRSWLLSEYVKPTVNHALREITPVLNTIVPNVARSVKEVADEIRNRFSMLQVLGNGVIAGNVTALMVSGAPGVGKTYELENKLQDAVNLRKINSFVTIKGSISPIGLYRTLYENREKSQIILLDDIDKVFADEETMNILKAALDSSVKRVVSWCKNSRFLEEQDIPNSFEYRGQVIFITNVDIDKQIAKESKMSAHMAALVSRSVFLDLCIHDPKEIMIRVEQVMAESTLREDLKLNETQAVEIIDWMQHNITALRSVSIRSVVQLASFVRTTDEWKNIAKATMLRRS